MARRKIRRINTSYDISEAFRIVEGELIDSMIRNLDHHRAEELKEGYNWSQWQVEQLAALDEYKKRNMRRYKGVFGNINNQIDTLISMQRAAGNADQEMSILRAIKEGAKLQKAKKNISAEGIFFKVNDEKINSLIKATQDDFKKAETAILRMVNDQYRKIIFNAQVYAMTGATYEKAVDMATKDFLSAGINCIEYSNGARHTMADYADMALRTAQKRAYLTGEGEKRMEWGISTVIMNKRGNPCPKCKPFVGKIFIDDVWSGGNKDGISETTGLKYPLISEAIKKGLYHPRCRDSHTTYFEGISTPPDDKYTKEELEELAENYNHEQRQQYAQRQAEKYGRLEKYSLDVDNKRKYRVLENQWKQKSNTHKLLFANGKSSSIIKNIELPCEISEISGITDDTVNAIYEALNKISQEYDVQVDEILVKSLGKDATNVPFQFNPKNNGGYLKSQIIINKDYYFNDSLESFTARIMRNYNRGILAAQNVEDLLAHEMAHVMTFQNCDTYGLFLAVEDEVREKFIKGVSGYADASYDGAETIAEAFVKYRHGEKLSEDVMDLLDEYIVRWKK